MNRAVVVTNVMPKTNRSPIVTINKFLSIMIETIESVALIGGNLEGIIERKEINIKNVKYKNNDNKIIKLIYYLQFQLKMFIIALQTIHKDDDVFFWIADKMIFPFIAAKLKRAKINYFLYGNVGVEGTYSWLKAISEKLIIYMANRADNICVESPSVIKQWKIRNKKANVRIIHLYVDKCTTHGMEKPQNKKTIGMVCRLTEGKRVLESISGFNEFHKKHPEWKLEIVGSGKLLDECIKKIEELNAKKYIEIIGWIEHKHVANYISTWTLLLFPTDTEGLPNSLVESMALYTPALASPVGGICDIIVDGENGWLLSKNTEKSIKEGLERALFCNNYSDISTAAYNTIKNKFFFESAVKNFKEQMGFN